MINKTFSILLPAFLFAAVCFGQPAGPSTAKSSVVVKQQAAANLLKEITRADSTVFNAFNNCDSLTYKKYFVPDLEFYHDLGGLTTGLDNELKSLKEMCARGNHIRRELDKNTLEVYELKGYGAVEIGVHRFYHTNPGQPEKLSGVYKFIHVWQFKNGEWKIARVISYNHNEVNNN